MKKLLGILSSRKSHDTEQDGLYKFVEKTSSREQVKIIKKAVLRANKEQRAVVANKG